MCFLYCTSEWAQKATAGSSTCFKRHNNRVLKRYAHDMTLNHLTFWELYTHSLWLGVSRQDVCASSLPVAVTVSEHTFQWQVSAQLGYVAAEPGKLTVTKRLQEVNMPACCLPRNDCSKQDTRRSVWSRGRGGCNFEFQSERRQPFPLCLQPLC